VSRQKREGQQNELKCLPEHFVFTYLKITALWKWNMLYQLHTYKTNSCETFWMFSALEYVLMATKILHFRLAVLLIRSAEGSNSKLHVNTACIASKHHGWPPMWPSINTSDVYKEALHLPLQVTQVCTQFPDEGPTGAAERTHSLRVPLQHRTGSCLYRASIYSPIISDEVGRRER
jgi:hypothetical protein